MWVDLPEKYQEEYQRIITFAREHINMAATYRDKEAVFDKDIWTSFFKENLLGLSTELPSAIKLSYLLEALSFGSTDGGFNFAVSAHISACLIPIIIHGTEEQKEKLVRNGINGNSIFSNAISEENAGSNIASMQTNAIPKGEGYLLNGSKSYASSAPVAETILVYAKSGDGEVFFSNISCFLIPRGEVNISKKISKMGLRSCPASKIKLDDVFVSTNQILGNVGNAGIIFLQSMDWEKLAMAAMHVGTMIRMIEICRSHAKKKTIDSIKMSSLTNIQYSIAEMLIKTLAVRQMVLLVASKIDEGKKASLEAAALKIQASETLIELASTAMNIIGSSAYGEEHEISRIYRDAIAAPIYTGTNDIQKNIIAAYLGLR